MGIFDFLNFGAKKPSIDLTDFQFVSDDHNRIQNNQKTNANNKGSWRGIRIQSTDNKIFITTIYNLIGTHPTWGDNIQMAPKQMMLIEETSERIVLRGYGTDALGVSFANYGITLHKHNGNIDRITLHMFDRHTEIVYYKGNPADMNKPNEASKPKEIPKNRQQSFLDHPISALRDYKVKWDTETSMQQKMMVAMQSDNLNNQGCDCYKSGNTDMAIEYFHKALQVMPINNDALLNLAISYNRKGLHVKALDPLKRLYYLSSTSVNKSKIIAYSLLLHLVDDFNSDGGAVIVSTLIEFIKNKFDIVTDKNETKQIVEKINKPYNRDIIIIGNAVDEPLLPPLPSQYENLYMTSSGTDLSIIKEELKDILNWK